ncbi:hypothetical protein BMJ20_21785 [Sinorhizobium medicae]|nr:hypothetical protein BMJ31_30135 [Sinorhizobium medicae]PLU47059.1 hypothetical protein BMJ24_34285 [Sinorhizobium medicae]PLU67750.1 hypothetical protein BMJ20_21785 [Sinorhizobium medicae]
MEDVRPLLRLRVFGPMGAWSRMGESILPRGRKAQAILAYLAMCGEAPVARRRLAGLLWSTRFDEQARASLRQSLTELRRGIIAIAPELLRIEKDYVSLHIAEVWIDELSISVGDHRPVSQRDPDTFLESLRGLDAAFDRWINTMVSKFTIADDMKVYGEPCNDYSTGGPGQDLATEQSNAELVSDIPHVRTNPAPAVDPRRERCALAKCKARPRTRGCADAGRGPARAGDRRVGARI